MTSFAVMEPIKHATTQNFASAIMKIQLQFGLWHKIVLDKDSKFFGAFKEACNLLQLN
jgi:rhamnogalacturonyl hydrolase YesR